MSALVRLHKYMASCGVASRRKCEQIIAAGEVTVNGTVVTVPGTKVDDEKDEVTCRGEKLAAKKKVYLIVNKPAGYLTTSSDPHGRKTVFDLVDTADRLFAVGRLDKDTEGLIILTNDGDTANRIAHPRNEVPKTYEVHTAQLPSKLQLNKLAGGMIIDGYRTRKAVVSVLRPDKRESVTRITICEGRNRQIRKMFSAVGLDVRKLKRTAIGRLTGKGLAPGKSRPLSAAELDLVLDGGE
jgi:23S rRNA pseudouridine2605 synthase